LLGCPQREQKLEEGRLPRHRHNAAYVSLVMDGGYRERGVRGRWSVEPGHLVAHASFECHDNLVARSGAWVLNVPVSPYAILPPVFSVADPDAIVATVRSGLPVGPFLCPAGVIPPYDLDWPDALAARLRREPVSITAWACETGLDPATVSRGFHAAFGVTPARYRLENQTLRAMRLLTSTTEPLAAIATLCGFADQAHLSRSIRWLSGHTPRTWRVKSIQDRRAEAAYEAG
jgi:AraC-like DNA-binding protein